MQGQDQKFARPGDKGAVARRLLLSFLAVSLAALAIAAPASAAGRPHIATGTVVAPAPTAAPSAATEGLGGLIAPASACPGQEALDAPANDQESTMSCMVDYARVRAGLAGFAEVEALQRSAEDKASDVLRCDSFSHFACGRDFTYWMRETGYVSSQCWRVGENLAWGTGEYGTVRSIFRAWMSSPGHRENILDDFTETGISLRIGTLSGQAGTHIWAEHFGSRC
jgi:uncharacterized protein YkwD